MTATCGEGNGTGATAAAHDSVFTLCFHRVVSNKKKFETRDPHIHVHIHTHRTRRFHAGHIITPRRRVRRLQASSRGSKPSHMAASSIEGVFNLPSYTASPSSSAPCMWRHIILHIAHRSCAHFWRRPNARRRCHLSCIPCDLHGHPAQHAQGRER